MDDIISSYFPNSRTEPFEITSPSSGEYNCIGWALGSQSRFIWPLRQRGFYWPRKIQLEETLTAFTMLFEEKGYQPCEHGNLEAGFQKIALFAKEGLPTHAARQLADGS